MKKMFVLAVIALALMISIPAGVLFFGEEDTKNKPKNTDEPEYLTLVFNVTDDHDDARTFIADNSKEGYGNEDGINNLLQLSPSYSFGLRFTNVTVPKNAKILDAYVEVYSIGTPGHTNPNCNIYCDDVDDASNFTNITGVLNISGRKYTENYVTWNETVVYDEWVKTPSITKSIQEIVDRKNWTSGNSIAVLFVSNGILGYVSTFQNFEKGFASRLVVVLDK